MSADSKSLQFQERRQSIKLRMLYPEVSTFLREVFHLREDWAGTSTDFIALRAIHERYRDLSSQEVRMLVMAAARNPCQPASGTRFVA